jgi:hypothetical protein
MKKPILLILACIFIQLSNGFSMSIDKEDSLIVYKIFLLNDLSELKMSYRTVLGEEGKIEGLDLYGLGLDTLPSDIANLKSLEKIDLRGNNFKAIPEVIKRMENLKEIGWKNREVEIKIDKKKRMKNIWTRINKVEARIKSFKPHLEKTYFIYIHPMSAILGSTDLLLYDHDQGDAGDFSPWLYLSLEKMIYENISISINLSLEYFITCERSTSPLDYGVISEKKELGFGYGGSAGVRYYFPRSQLIYTGLNLAYFQLPDNFYLSETSRYILRHYYSMGLSTGLKFSLTKKLVAFVEFGLFPLIHNHTVEGYSNSGGNGLLVVAEIAVDLLNAAFMQYKGPDLNIGIGIGF